MNPLSQQSWIAIKVARASATVGSRKPTKDLHCAASTILVSSLTTAPKPIHHWFFVKDASQFTFNHPASGAFHFFSLVGSTLFGRKVFLLSVVDTNSATYSFAVSTSTSGCWKKFPNTKSFLCSHTLCAVFINNWISLGSHLLNTFSTKWRKSLPSKDHFYNFLHPTIHSTRLLLTGIAKERATPFLLPFHTVDIRHLQLFSFYIN
jgi:hypothetical protein